MRHQKAGRKLSRTSSHRHAMFCNMLSSLVIHERIETTDAKAKELKRIADRAISWGTSVGDLLKKGRDKLDKAEKGQVVHAMRMAGRYVKQREALDKLFGVVAPRYVGRSGGFTRVLKTRVRLGDAAPMSFVELVGRENEKIPAKEPAAGASAKGGEKKAKAPAAAKAAAPKKSRKKADDAEA